MAMIRCLSAVVTFCLVAASPAHAEEQVPALPDALPGVWQGEYQCPQGRTYLLLSVDAAKMGKAQAVFYFFPPPGTNPGETGCFTMTADADKVSGSILLRQGRWLQQPPNYIMIDLKGELSPDGDRFTGKVVEDMCGAFTLTKVLPKADMGDACRPLTQ
jgi:hypothetical protein